MSSPSSQTSEVDIEAQKMLTLLEKYTATFPERPQPSRKQKQGGDVILLTGTTGGFGCNILGQLSLDPTVKQIYALNRSSASEELVLRQINALNQRGVLDVCTRSPKFQLLEADLSKPYLGLDLTQYNELRDSVTHIIHNAWPVTLLKPLTHFGECLQGLRNLIDLALASSYAKAPKFLFVSSVSSVRKFTGRALEEHNKDPSVSIGSGYSETKWIAEHILLAASERTGLSGTTVRVGVIAGDPNGHWTTSDMYPLMVKSAVALKCLPDVEGTGLVSWIPSWEAAAALCAMRHTTEPVLHLANPNPVPWRDIFQVFAEQMEVPLVPYSTWLSLLQDDSRDQTTSKSERMKRNPALRLIPYFQAADMGQYKEPVGHTRMDLTKAMKAAPMLKDVRIERDQVVRWVRKWRESGFLPPKGEQTADGRDIHHLSRL